MECFSFQNSEIYEIAVLVRSSEFVLSYIYIYIYYLFIYIFIRHEDRKNEKKTRTIKHNKENTIYDNA